MFEGSEETGCTLHNASWAENRHLMRKPTAKMATQRKWPLGRQLNVGGIAEQGGLWLKMFAQSLLLNVLTALTFIQGVPAFPLGTSD